MSSLEQVPRRARHRPHHSLKRQRSSLRRSLIAGPGLLAALLLCLAAPSVAGAAVNVGTLNLDSKTGPENYVFTAGNTIYAQGKVDSADSSHLGRSHRFVFTDPAGAVRGMTACTPNGSAGGAVSGAYAVQASDPASNSATWKVVNRQYLDQQCATLEKASGAVAFNVAKATSYANAGLTTQAALFGKGANGYLTVAGLTAAKADWVMSWLLPGGATACANTLGADRPDSDANGGLPTGSGAFLQYAPGVALGAAWNLQSNYDGGCPAFSPANDGAWSLALKKDATHFVTLPAFAVDATPPSSSANSPAYPASGNFEVSYSASDSGAAASGLGKVDLYAKGPGDSSYSKVASDSSPGASGSFDYSAAKGEGAYSFYTVATDRAGNAEASPSGADSTTTLDATTPSSQASAPQYASTGAISVSYTATDPGADGSGLAKVDLYAKAPGDSSYSKVASDSSPGASGSLSYAAGGGDGSYDFYTVVTDKAGNVEAEPSGPDATTSLDTTRPSSQAGSPQYSTSAGFTVSYTASDPGSSASELAKVDLYAKGPGEGGYSKVASDSSPGASGSLSYSAAAGEGSYAFYTVATDRAGNAEAVPSGADTTTLLDTKLPT